MKIVVAVALLLACLSPIGTGVAPESIVSVRAIPPAGPLTPGEPAVLTIELEISSGYHINSNRPLEDYLIPTTLGFASQPELRFGMPEFPAALVRSFPFSDKPMSVYEGKVRIPVEISPASDLNVQQVMIAGTLRFQACNDRACLPPATRGFTLQLPVGAMTQPQREQKVAPVFEPAAGAQGTSPVAVSDKSATVSYSTDFAGKGLLLTFVMVFLGGLALNLTPCVYPMIPITITYFGGQAQGKKGSIALHSFVYVVGMAVTYSVLGVAAAMTGGLFGSVHQYPAVLIGISVVMILLALSMFDVYELRMPQALNRLAGTSQKGFWGTFLMGLTVGIVAAPCIGPFVLGLLTYVGNKGNAILGFALFFVLALGLGVPFLVLGFFSGSIRRLPRSGAWMVWVRKVFGFVLLAMSVYFLKTLFPDQLSYQLTLAMLLFVAGIYLAWIDPVQVSGKTFPLLRNLVGIGFFAVALYSGISGLQARFEASRIAGGNAAAANAIEWLPYSDEALRLADRQSKPVFIDFYADWCAPCKELDRHTFAAPETVSLSRKFVMLKVDLTSAGDPKAELLRKKYQARGVPTLVFLRPDGEEILNLRATGFEPKNVFLGRMKQALEAVSGRQSPVVSPK
jgi:thiol:disulfide interchange protein DsbD